MLAQYSGSDSGAAALGIIIALALIALQIYLIYAIIATRQDVKTLRDFLMPRTPSQAYVGWGQTGPTLPATQAPSPPLAPTYLVIFRSPGNRPDAVERVLMEQVGYARSGARGAIRNPGQQILATSDLTRAQQVDVAIREAGGTVEIQRRGGEPLDQSEPSPTASPVNQGGVTPSADMSDEFKTCPDCAEEVRAAARKCRFCGHVFDEPPAPLSS